MCAAAASPGAGVSSDDGLLRRCIIYIIAGHRPRSSDAICAALPWRRSSRVCVRCSVVQDPDAPLTPAQIDHFLVNGYVALPGFFPDDFNEAMKRDVDRLVDDRAAKQAAPLIASYGTLGELCSYPPIVDKICQLMASYGNGETACGMHHIHATRQDAGTGPSNWHQVRQPAMARACASLHL
eukprot:COSAG06_NODE_11756_length_1468_cov_3.776005_5_plen_182_part_00